MRSFINRITTLKFTFSFATLLTLTILNLAFVQDSSILKLSLLAVNLIITAYAILHATQSSGKLVKLYYVAFIISILGLALNLQGPVTWLIVLGHIVSSCLLAFIIGRSVIEGDFKQKLLAGLSILIIMSSLLRVFLPYLSPEHSMSVRMISLILFGMYIVLEKNKTIKTGSLFMLLFYALILSSKLRTSLQAIDFMELLQ